MAPPFCFDSEGTEKYRDRTQPPRGTGSKHLSMSSSDLPGPDDAARRKPAISRPVADGFLANRSEEHTSELQSLMRTSYAVFCLKNKKHNELTLSSAAYPSERAGESQ